MTKKKDIFEVFFRKKPAMILVALRNDGRIKLIRLTENGNKIAESIEKIKNLL